MLAAFSSPPHLKSWGAINKEQSQEQDETETLSEDESQAPVTQTM